MGIIRCDQCVFWRVATGDPHTGRCHRKAPTAPSAWPLTYNYEGCGEGQKAPVAAADLGKP